MTEYDPIYCLNGGECSYGTTKCQAWDVKNKSCHLQFMVLVSGYTSSAQIGETVTTATTLQDALKGYLNLLDISSDLETIKMRKFSDQWDNINMIMKSFGYTWGGEEKNKKWSKTGKVVPEPQQSTSQQKITKANEKPFTNCKDVVDGMKSLKIHGKLLDDPIEQELKTKKGPMTVVKTRIDDGTSPLRITFWNPSKVPILKAGDEITVDGLLGSAPYDGLPQASGGDYVKIIFEK